MATIPEQLTLALQHHQAGRLQAAVSGYRQILTVDPNHAAAIHLLGVIAYQVGKHEVAVQYIGLAIALERNVAAFHSNLGGAYYALHKIPEAIACYRQALELKPDDAEANYNLGNVLCDQGKLVEAVACYRQALGLDPDYVAAHNNLGNALNDQGKLDEAVACYQRVLELNPDFAEVHSNLSTAFKQLGKLNEAVACSRRALELKPDFAEAHYNLGNALFEQGKADEAVACYRQALQLKPDHAAAHNNLGNALSDRGKLDEAVACYCQALHLNPDFAEALNNLSNVFKEQGKLEEAVACCRRALELKPDFAEAHNNLGSAFKVQGKLDEAVACCRRALEIDPDLVDAHYNLGNTLSDQGKLAEAVACYRRALELNPDYAEAHNNLGSHYQQIGDFESAQRCWREALRHDPLHAKALAGLAILLRDRLPVDELAALERLTSLTEVTLVDRASLHFGMANVREAQGEYATAAHHLAEANSLRLVEHRTHGHAYDSDEHDRLVAAIMDVFSSFHFDRVRGLGADSERPIFIFGLPRTGTTLTEQVLAGHSKVFGVGEMQLAGAALRSLPQVTRSRTTPLECVAVMDQQTLAEVACRYLAQLKTFDECALRIVDKMPDNYLHLGFLTTLFPQARFIHCRRDLRDVAVSCWMTDFREIYWSNDIHHIAARFCAYERLMEHWRRVLPAPILDVEYEDTVADLEGTARRLIDWCGLDWEPQCLSFHTRRNPVRTASAIQVRQPIYQRAVGRWKCYADVLAPLFTLLRPGQTAGPE